MTSEKSKPVVIQHSLIGKYAETLPPSQNSVFSEDEINCFSYQAHLERIADFLLRGEGVWWHFDKDMRCIIFHDGADQQSSRLQGPPLHHFRSWTVRMERAYLAESWKSCISNSQLLLPTSKINLYNSEGDFIGHNKYIADFLQDENIVPTEFIACGDKEEEMADVHGCIEQDISGLLSQDEAEDNDDIPIGLAVVLSGKTVSDDQLVEEDQMETVGDMTPGDGNQTDPEAPKEVVDHPEPEVLSEVSDQQEIEAYNMQDNQPRR